MVNRVVNRDFEEVRSQPMYRQSVTKFSLSFLILNASRTGLRAGTPLSLLLLGALAIAGSAQTSYAQTSVDPAIAPAPIVNITVNSDLDGPNAPDQALTLREAIEIANGTLPLTALSPAESALVLPAASPRIEFALPADTRIELVEVLPAIVAAGLVIDGTTQPGYGAESTQPAAVPVAVPAVSITSAAGTEVFRGLTITANNVTIRGLSLYGFASKAKSTATTPSADIFITHIAPVPGTDTGLFRGPERVSAETLRIDSSEYDLAPKGVVIEDNWLGVSPVGGIPATADLSAFGVYVFNATDTVVQRNRIEYHLGSGLITGNLAQGLIVTENTIIGNGLKGMADGIRFEGDIDGAKVFSNLVCANDGSGLAMFKPQGSANIYDNDIRFNGRRLRSSGVSLMGNGHQVTNNFIAFQPGPGVGITAYPNSTQNIVQGNYFRQLDGLSVDLTYHYGTQPSDFQFSDGPNPPRNSSQRRRDSANAAINAPEFDAYVFSMSGATTQVTGRADPGSDVGIYQAASGKHYSELGDQLTTVTVGEDGRFSADVSLPEGARVSAIATDSRYGTSEPSPAAAIGVELPPEPRPAYQPVCQDPPLPPEIVAAEPPAPITLRVPRNIHFALDRSFISAQSANILDQIAAAMTQYPSLTVELEGHTDPRASNAYNQALGERRALAARDYLLQQGIAPERMRIRSFGETQLISNRPDVVDYARDRRVEFIFSDTRGLDIIFENTESDLQVE